MGASQYQATVSQGPAGWRLSFLHPVARAANSDQALVIHEELGDRTEAEVKALAAQVDAMLSDNTYWNLEARPRASSNFEALAVAAFYDCLPPESSCGWDAREQALPLPSREEGYAKVQLVGTTGGGKTTVVRQLLGTDPVHERFPSTSAAKTTICDLEIITGGDDFQAAVSFISREKTRHHIMECVSAAVSAHLENSPRGEVVRRFMEHHEQRFRLSYLLGKAPPAKADPSEEELLDDVADGGLTADVQATSPEQAAFAAKLQGFLDRLFALAASSQGSLRAAACQQGIDLERASTDERDALLAAAEQQLQHEAHFHRLVDAILAEVEAKFALVACGDLRRAPDGWPTLWTYRESDRHAFIRTVNCFSSNYAGHFGKLLTPLVEGIRVRGPFVPAWHAGDSPRLVLMDGQGIGHTADSTSSVSTGITKRFAIADSIILVDNAAQPLQAAPVSVLRTVLASGHESKLVLAFTHFDEVKGDNLSDIRARKEHVAGSYHNAVRALGKSCGREAEQALKRLDPDRLVFLANIQAPLPDGAKYTRHEFGRLLAAIKASIAPPPPTEFFPVYEAEALDRVVRQATQEFHEHWRALLGLPPYEIAREHWSRVKALSRHVAYFEEDEYDSLRPVADLIQALQAHISEFLAEPVGWSPDYRIGGDEELCEHAIADIRRDINARLHGFARRRVREEQLLAWSEAAELHGAGSTKKRAESLVALYGRAAPVPDVPLPRESSNFLFELRKLTAAAIAACGGRLREGQPLAVARN